MELSIKEMIQVLKKTRSTNAAEALAAIRLANALLDQSKLTWEILFKSLQKRPKTELEIENEEYLLGLFKSIEEMIPLGFNRTFFDSVYSHFRKGKTLSEKQISALEKIKRVLTAPNSERT